MESEIFFLGMGTFDALLDIICVRQVPLDRRRELAVLQIDISDALESMNHPGL